MSMVHALWESIMIPVLAVKIVKVVPTLLQQMRKNVLLVQLDIHPKMVHHIAHHVLLENIPIQDQVIVDRVQLALMLLQVDQAAVIRVRQGNILLQLHQRHVLLVQVESTPCQVHPLVHIAQLVLIPLLPDLVRVVHVL